MKRIVSVAVAFTALGVGIASPVAAAEVAVSACGQEVPGGHTGRLQQDLECPGSEYAVLLNSRSHLELNGHAISGGAVGVFLNGRHATIEGPGEIAGATDSAVLRSAETGPGRVVLRNVDVHDNGWGINLGIGARSRLALSDVTLTDNTHWPVANCDGLTLHALRVTVTRNSGGVCGKSIHLVESTVTDNTGPGVFNWQGSTRLRDSVVTGNISDEPVLTGPVDLATVRRPRLVRTSCDHSVVMNGWLTFPPGEPSWGVCTGDA